tara:strand:+ start:18 stop:302 length:285 start_codon:yes stop_codon:yes gene_type:complete
MTIKRLTMKDFINSIPLTKDMRTLESHKVVSCENVKQFYLKPSKLFSNKSLGRLTVRKNMCENDWGKSILKELKVSGVSMTRREKELYEQYFVN